MPADSPRLRGIDAGHVRRLASISTGLPPIVVHRPTMRVVDGMHRIRAALARGLDSIEAVYVDDAEDLLFLRSVTANIEHGLPLSVADRKAAAERILASHPSLSDRAIASYVGLDAKTVAGVRVCSAAGAPPLNVRTGSDGRAHPLDRTTERIHAAELMSKDPSLPLRAVVKETGLSLGTAHDVRRRLLRGEDPVPPARHTPTDPHVPVPEPSRPASPAERRDPPARPTAASVSPRTRVPLEAVRRLAHDPSLRHSESGRDFIRWIHSHVLVDEAWRRQIATIPPHCVETVADIARHCSETWRRFAEELAVRRHTDVMTPVEMPMHSIQR